MIDALQGDDDAAADKAIRLVPHFVGGLTRNAPGRRKRTSDGDETDAFDEADEICIEDDAEVLNALETRLSRTLPARSEDWASNEFVEVGKSRARNDASALGAAYGACGAPRLLALLSRRIPALKDTLGRSVRRGLRAAAVGVRSPRTTTTPRAVSLQMTSRPTVGCWEEGSQHFEPKVEAVARRLPLHL